ncbi:MAG: penicillin-binding transpeptidase domain-containing protein, partial [Gemmiger sp.]|nr:penicillin-binding transpeptidase domain-containing protein [Gemmiger sp.]
MDKYMGRITLLLMSAFLIFGFGLLIYQLYALQIRDPESYRADAAEQQLSDEVLPAARGSIYGATGKLLAKSSVVWNIIADPSRCDQATVGQMGTKIGELLGIDGDEVTKKLSDEASQYKIIAKKVDMPTAKTVLDYAATLNEAAGKTVLSLTQEESSTREYPYGSFLASVLGFCNDEGSGFYGLEKSYQDTLAGTDGRSVSTQNAFGYELANDDADVHEAIDGLNLNLSIDEYIQGVVEQYLGKAVEDYNVQNRASAIVMNVNTGAVLAMATMPQFDPNTPYAIYDETLSGILEGGLLDAGTTATLQSRLGIAATADIVADGQISSKEYNTVQGMMREAQWKNKNITELYFPGSVFKLATAAAALDSGLMTVDQSFNCTGELTVAENSTQWKTTYHCAAAGEGTNTTVHGWQDMTTALNNSCNLYFIQVGQTLGAQLFYDYFEAFGFTGITGVDLPSETRWMKYYDEKTLGLSELASSAFGQAQKITPLQMATAVAAVVNGGYLVTPYVVDSITDASGNIVEQTSVSAKRQVISEEVSAQIRTMMENVVGEGAAGHSGRNAYVAGYRIGGKSGTSEQLDIPKRYDGDWRKASSFTAVLPINDPEIVVLVMLDDPRWNNDYASQIVAPVVGNIISDIAPYLGIERDPNYDTGAMVNIPNCVGNAWNDAQIALNKSGFGHKLMDGTGTIVYQYPYAGTSAPAGSTIYLYTLTDQDTMVTVPDVVGKTGSFAAQMLRAAGLN